MSDNFYLKNLAQATASASATLALNTVTQVTAATALTMTLPAPAAGALIVVEREAASTASVAVTGNIRGVGSATITLSLASESQMFLGTATTWNPVADHKTLGSLDARYPQLGTAGNYTADQYFKSGRPWFDVIAFGADPTGAADSTTAIQTAINTALGLRTDTGVSMSGFTVTDAAAVSGDVGKYVNSPNYATIVSYPVGVTASNATMQITGVAAAPFAANQPVVLTAAAAPTGFTAGTTYFIKSPSQVSTTFSFSLSATSGGAAITPASTGTTVAVQQVTGGCSLIASVTPGVGYTVTTPAAASLSGQVVAVGTGSSVNIRTPTGPLFIPAGTYKITSDLLIQSVFGFRLMTAGHNITTLKASGGGFTTAILNIDGTLDGHYSGLQFSGDGTEGTGGVASSGIPAGLNLTWTTSATRSTSGNTLEHFRVRSLKFVSGVSLAGVGIRQLDGTQLQDIVVTGGQPSGGWSASARTDTGVCGTSTGTPNTVTDTAAVSGDFGMLISGPGIPAGAKITAVAPGTGYTISGTGATATASGVTFIVGTGLWQAGFQFGNGSQGNIYDQAMYGCSPAGCYIGYNCNLSSFALFSAQPGANGTDFVLIPGAQCTVENVQSQGSRQFLTAATSGSIDAVSFRDCQYSGYKDTGFNPVWISVDTLQGSLVLENVTHGGIIANPVIALGSANYHAQFTLINVSQKAAPSAGITVSGSAAVIAINYSDTTAGVGTNAVLYPFYAINAGVLFQQGTASARPAASAFGELFYYATDTGALSHSNGSSWTGFTSTSPTAPDIQWITATGTTTWTKPAGAVTVQALIFGPGAGGGSGRRGAAGTVRCGGAGGGGGAVAQKQFAASDLPSTVTVTVSPGGAGGAAVTADSTSGNAGIGGSATSFGAFLSAAPGNPGAGGTAAGGNGGSGGVAGTTPGGPGQTTSTTGGVGANAALSAGGAGGSCGGGITAADVAGNGALGNNSCLGAGTQGGAAASAGGVVDTTAPTSGAQTSIKGALGVAGGSGAASITTAAQAAAASVGIAAGGSGGGASLNGNNSGAGGAGGPGAALIISFFQ